MADVNFLNDCGGQFCQGDSFSKMRSDRVILYPYGMCKFQVSISVQLEAELKLRRSGRFTYQTGWRHRFASQSSLRGLNVGGLTQRTSSMCISVIYTCMCAYTYTYTLMFLQKPGGNVPPESVPPCFYKHQEKVTPIQPW